MVHLLGKHEAKCAHSFSLFRATLDTEFQVRCEVLTGVRKRTFLFEE